MTRPRWIVVAVVGLGVVVAVALLAPIAARGRVETLISARSGCDARVGSVRLGASAVGLAEVTLQCGFGTARFDDVQVAVDWASQTPTEVRISGGRVRLTSRPSRVASAGEPRGSPSGPTAAPRVFLDSVWVEVVDGETVLGRGTLAGEGRHPQWALVATDLATSSDHDPVLTAAEARVSLHATDAVVEGAEVSGLSMAARDAPSIYGALRRWLEPDEETTRDVLTARHDEVPAERPIWGILREGGTLSVSGATVRDADGEALSDLHVEATRVRDAELHVSGRGRPRGAGDLSWDLHVDALEQRMDGPIVIDHVPLSAFLPLLPELPVHDPARTLVSAQARVVTGDSGALSFEGRLVVEGLAVESARIASAPVLGISFEVEGRGSWQRNERTVQLERGVLRTGGASASLVGRVRMDRDEFALSLRAALPPTSCDRAVHAIPPGLLQELTALHLEGRIAASVEVAVDSERLDETVLRFAVEDGCRFTSAPSSVDVARFTRPFIHEVLEPDGTTFRMETGPGTSAWTPLAEVSPFFVHAVLAHEDASFFQHRGFAPWAIRDALVRNLRERRYVLGASTITMQLVKNVFLRREKTLARKVQEVLLTWWLESTLTKPQILELYVNVIEYGPGIYGIRNAAAHYFGRAPSELSVAEAAYLAMILPNPPRFHEHYDEGAVPPSFLRRTRGFVGVLEHRGRIDAEAATQGLEELDAFSFARDGRRVGPDILRGGSAPLPIEGFSGFPAASWVSDEEGEEADEDLYDEGWEDVSP